jgi:hypothetical protein
LRMSARFWQSTRLKNLLDGSLGEQVRIAVVLMEPGMKMTMELSMRMRMELSMKTRMVQSMKVKKVVPNMLDRETCHLSQSLSRLRHID